MRKGKVGCAEGEKVERILLLFHPEKPAGLQTNVSHRSNSPVSRVDASTFRSDGDIIPCVS